MEKIKIENLFNLEETIAKDIFKGCEFDSKTNQKSNGSAL